MSEPIMEFIIELHPDEVTRMECATGKVAVIPFGGSVKSDLFTGIILPGAATTGGNQNDKRPRGKEY